MTLLRLRSAFLPIGPAGQTNECDSSLPYKELAKVAKAKTTVAV